MDNWIHRSRGMKCQTCIWYMPKAIFDDETDKPMQTIGRCRKKAPTMDGWPVMFPTDWCGDHKLDENKV